MTRFVPIALLTALLAASGCTTNKSATGPSRLLADQQTSAALDCRIVWQTDLGLAAGQTIESAGPLGDVFVVFEKGNVLTVLDADTGKTRWRRSVGTEAERFTRPTLHDQHVIICSETQLYAYRLDNGDLALTFKLQHNAHTDPIIFAGFVILGSPDGLLFAQTLRGGYLVWRYQMGGAIATNPLLAGSTLFVADESGQVAGLNAQTGLIIWRRSRPPWGAISAQPAGDNTLAFVACHDQKLYAFERASGSLFWQYLDENPLTEPPVVIGEHVYQRSKSRGLICLDTLSGNTLWNSDLVGKPVQIRNQNLMLLDQGTINLLDVETGQSEGQIALPLANQIFFTAPKDGDLYLLNRDGRIMKLQPR